MNTHKKNIMERFLALALVVIITFDLLPLNIYASNVKSLDDISTIQVVDANGYGVEDVTVSYEIKKDGIAEITNSSRTNSEGYIVLSEMESYIDYIAQGKITISYTATKKDYDTNEILDIVVSDSKEKFKLTILESNSEKVSINTNKVGNGSIKINGVDIESITVDKGDIVSLEIKANEKSYIKELTINKKEIMIEKYDSYYVEEYIVEENTEISVEFQIEYTLTLEKNEGGKVFLDNDEKTSVTVDKDTDITLRVKPDKGYQIASIIIDNKEEIISDVNEFTKEIQIDKDIDITITFVKVYVISIAYNGDNGKVTTTSQCEAGKVIIKEGSRIEIIATPNKNYRVQQVNKNGDTIDFTVNDAIYTDTIENVKEDYSYEIIFAPNRHKVKSTAENGTIELEKSLVDYDGSVDLTLIPKDNNYRIKSIVIKGNNADINVDLESSNNYFELEDGTAKYTVANIIEDINIEVIFEEIPVDNSGQWTDKVNITAISGELKSSYKDKDGNLVYVYSNDAVLEMKAIAPYNETNYKLSSESNYKGWNSNREISESCEIEVLQVRTGGYGNAKTIGLNGKKIVIIIDKSSPEVTITPDEANENGYYNNNVNVKINVSDKNETGISGIDTIEYWVICDGIETYYDITTFNGNKDEIPEVDATINFIVNANKNNSDNVEIIAKVTDISGNVTKASEKININKTVPKINIDMTENSKEEAINGYYSTRQAIITITDRETTFSEEAVSEGIIIKATDVNGKEIIVNTIDMLGKWTTVKGDTPDTAKHIAVLNFDIDANYQWSISYKNKAGVSSDASSITTSGDNLWKFTVDNVAPETAIIKVRESKWNKLLSVVTFGLWTSKEVKPEAEAKDNISPIKEIKYYKSNEEEPLSGDELEELYKNDKFIDEQYTISSDEGFVVYARITDCAGNTKYISTDGIIVDTTESEITLTPDKPNKNGIYNDDVNVTVDVNEKVYSEKDFSGIKTVDYVVKCDGKETQKENLYRFDIENPTKDQLKETFTGNIKVDKEKNNSDNVVVKVIVEDNAGIVTEKEIKLSINIDRPEVKISFEDKVNKVVDGNGYFGSDRIATIEIIDRASSFDGEAATAGINIDAVDGKGKKVELELSDMISSWSHEDNIHKATVKFKNDGNYTWSFDYTNKADLKMNDVVTEGTTPFKFTVDKENPTATITVNESIWDKLLKILTFGLYSNRGVKISATADDATSPVTIEYYKTSNAFAMNKEQLDTLKFEEFNGLTLTNDEQFVVYLKVADYSGNYIYINSDGYIIDKKPSKITLTPDIPNKNGIYNKDVNIKVEVSDEEPYSGIKTIEYWVVKDNDNANPTQKETLYTFDVEKPTQKELMNQWNGNITVDASKNNSCNVVVYVRTVDNANNESIQSVVLDIDVSKPEISVSYDNNKDNGGNGYFDANRTATVTIKERTHHFDPVAAIEGIIITAVDAKGNKVEIDRNNMISSWNTTESGKADEAIHTATILYSKDANYTFEVSYTDKADNSNKAVNTGNSQKPYKFTVDKVAPTGTVTSTTSEGRVTTWNELIDNLTFGIWSNSKITIEGTSEDITSPVASVEYYKTSDTKAKTIEELQAITNWNTFSSIIVNPNEQFTIYIKMIDKAGNTSYISTDGMIVDNTAPREESIAPEIKVSPQQPINDIYNGDVKVSIDVEDPLVSGTYSGLKTVSYRVLNQGKETQSGILYSFKNDSPTHSELVKKWTGEITVNSKLNNSNDVVIEVYAEDNSLNSSKDKVSIKIDITNPTINITYNNNTPDSNKYYKDTRIATVVVTERNFKAEDVMIKITNTDGSMPVISQWVQDLGDGNQDNTTHTATITYDADGDYTFDIAYTDLANNKCTGETYSLGTVNEKEFTIDKTIPEISVSYDNNASNNDRYFKANRTATVTVVEHNFDVSRVQFTQTASLDGNPISTPTPIWSSNGDIHTATIGYNSDGDYTFDVTMKDMAGNDISSVNYGGSIAAKEFTVDTNIVKPEITGVENGKAYKGDVIPVVNFSDINYSDYKITLTRTRIEEKSVDVTEEFIKTVNIGHQGGSGSYDTFTKEQENDGIYNLTVKISDKAGNESEESIIFTLNRFGSVYEYSDYLSLLVKDGGAYVRAVEDDIVITEYNADRLVDDSIAIEITRDGRPIENPKYHITPEINSTVVTGDSGWFQYKYIISKDNFAEDGIYKMSVSSKDATGNTPENSNYEDKGILFRVDTTAPELTSVVGLEDKIINAHEVEVKYDIYDTIGLKSVKVYINDNLDGEEITEFIEDKNNYSGSFILKESGSAQKIRIVIEDLAGNVTDTDLDDFNSAYAFERMVTVSTNIFVRWYANKGLFWGSIGAVAVTIGSVTGLTIVRKRKNIKKEN